MATSAFQSVGADWGSGGKAGKTGSGRKAKNLWQTSTNCWQTLARAGAFMGRSAIVDAELSSVEQAMRSIRSLRSFRLSKFM